MTEFADLIDKTPDVRAGNPDLNSTDRVFELSTNKWLKVRITKRDRSTHNANAQAYTISISQTDGNGKAKARAGFTRAQAKEAVENEGANPADVFEIGAEHSLTMVIDGDVAVEQTMQDIITQEVNRFQKLQSNRNKASQFIEKWSA